jgi:hypothetical protein
MLLSLSSIWISSHLQMNCGHPTWIKAMVLFHEPLWCVEGNCWFKYSCFHTVTWLINCSLWHATKHDGPQTLVEKHPKSQNQIFFIKQVWLRSWGRWDYSSVEAFIVFLGVKQQYMLCWRVGRRWCSCKASASNSRPTEGGRFTSQNAKEYREAFDVSKLQNA